MADIDITGLAGNAVAQCRSGDLAMLSGAIIGL